MLKIEFLIINVFSSYYFMTILVRILVMAWAAQAVKRKAGKPSSLFEAYAMYPYGYYMQPYPMMPPPGPAYPGGYPMMAAQSMPPQPPPYPYGSYYMPQGYYPMAPFPSAARPQVEPPQVGADPEPAIPDVPVNTPVPVRFVEKMNPEPRRVTVEKRQKPDVSTPNPLKDALASALNEASQQIDKANKHAKLNFVSFDDLDFAPHHSTAAPVSLSAESVPIDDHILNWRELVGLPASNPVMKAGAPVLHDGVTPHLDGAPQ